jgi:thioredoxin reductase
MHGFVTRDGIPPQEFRRLAWEQLAPYEVEKREARVTAIEGSAGEFRVQTSQGEIIAKRIVLAVGLIDEVPSLPGFRELWGHAIFQCPYCHAWEVQERPYGVILASLEMIPFVYLLRVWSKDLVVFPSGNLSLPEEARAGLVAAGVQLEERPIVGLRSEAGKLAAVQVSGGAEVAREFLFYRPAQHQPELVTQLGLALDSNGFLLVNEQRQTSITGIYAAGDSTTMMQSALNGAATGALAAAMLNHDLALSTIPGAASHTPSPAR